MLMSSVSADFQSFNIRIISEVDKRYQDSPTGGGAVFAASYKQLVLV